MADENTDYGYLLNVEYDKIDETIEKLNSEIKELKKKIDELKRTEVETIDRKS